MRNLRRRCARCRRYACKRPTTATPLALAPRPHNRLCTDCAPAVRDEFRPVSQGQISALHAKCNTLARHQGGTSADWKTEVKEAAAGQFGSEVVSFKDLSYEQASWCLDWLDERNYAHA